MIKKYLFLFVCLSGLTVKAQLHSVGFHLGTMGTSLGNNFQNGNTGIKIDFLAGLSYQYRFSNHLVLEGAFEFAQFGAQAPITIFDFTGNELGTAPCTWDWNYLSIPLTTGFVVGGKVRFKPKIGLVPSILVRSVYNFKPYEGSSLTPSKTSYYSDANKIDLAALAGIDVNFPIREGVFFIGTDFRYSVTKVNTSTLFNEVVFDSFRHRGLSLVLGVRFNIGNPEPEGPKDIIEDPLK